MDSFRIVWFTDVPKLKSYQAKKKTLDSLGLHSDKVTRTILGDVIHNEKKIEFSKQLYPDPLKRYHPC